MSDLSVLEDLSRQIRSLEEKKTQLLCGITEIDDAICRAQAKQGRIQNQRAPIHTLPTELITNIFMTCKELSAAKPFALAPFEVIATHVSSAWREVVIGSPLFWTVISVEIQSSSIHLRRTGADVPRTLGRLAVYLMRSGPCALDVLLKVIGDTEAAPIIELVSQHTNRLRRLSVSGPRNRSLGDAILNYFGSKSAPLLEYVSLNVNSSGESLSQPFMGGAESLKFAQVFFSLHPPLTSCTTLHISGAGLDIVYTEFRELLNSASNLIHLSLSDILVEPPSLSEVSEQTVAPIAALNLQSLRFWRAPIINPVVSSMSMPRLEFVILGDLETFGPMVFPAVHTLRLVALFIEREDMMNILRAFPALTTLQIDNSVPEILAMLTTSTLAKELEPWWPKLHTLSLVDLEPVDIPLLCSFVANRKATGSPFSRVCLDKRSRTVLRAKNLMDWLQEMVQVGRIEDMVWPKDAGFDNDHDF